MSLSKLARKFLVVGLASNKYGKEIADAIDAGGNAQAADVPVLVPGPAVVDPDTEARLAAIESSLNAILVALKNAGLMA